MELKVKKLWPDAKIPSKLRNSDVGFDLYAYGIEHTHMRSTSHGWSCAIEPGDNFRITTGVAFEIPSGYFGLICGRSSLAAEGFDVLGGVIDESYRGEIIVCLNCANFSYDGFSPRISQGDKVAQLLILPATHFHITEVDELSISDRGTKGFGSSGK